MQCCVYSLFSCFLSLFLVFPFTINILMSTMVNNNNINLLAKQIEYFVRILLLFFPTSHILFFMRITCLFYVMHLGTHISRKSRGTCIVSEYCMCGLIIITVTVVY